MAVAAGTDAAPSVAAGTDAAAASASDSASPVVLSVWMAPDANYAFVELSSVELAAQARTAQHVHAHAHVHVMQPCPCARRVHAHAHVHAISMSMCTPYHQALLLNGLTLLGNALRISRPANYAGPLGGDPVAACTHIDALVASIGATPAGSAAAAAAATAATAATGLPALPAGAGAAAPAAASRLIGGASGREAVLARCLNPNFNPNPNPQP